MSLTPRLSASAPAVLDAATLVADTSYRLRGEAWVTEWTDGGERLPWWAALAPLHNDEEVILRDVPKPDLLVVRAALLANALGTGSEWAAVYDSCRCTDLDPEARALVFTPTDDGSSTSRSSLMTLVTGPVAASKHARIRACDRDGAPAFQVAAMGRLWGDVDLGVLCDRWMRDYGAVSLCMRESPSEPWELVID